MSNRPKKHKKTIRVSGSFQKVIDRTFGGKPDGEDFFVFTIFLDDPASVTNELAYSFMGSWEQSTKSLVAIMDNFIVQARPSKIAVYQGDRARDYLGYAAKEEIRYQQQRKSQPNN